MLNRKAKLASFLLVLAVFSFMPLWVVEACSTCFGDPNSQMAKGVNSAVLVMLGIILVVLVLFGSLIFFFKKRAKEIHKS